MAQQAAPRRAARLGRPVGADGAVNGVILLLPDGRPESVRPPSSLAAVASWPLARALVRAGQEESLVCHGVRYRCRGWNGAAAHPADDVEWALEEVVRRYGDVAVCLVGTGLGGRAALRAAGHSAVQSVAALAPWLPEPAEGVEPEPVRQLTGRQVLLVHGTNDQRTDPALSFQLAGRAKQVNANVCRFEVHTDGHRLRHYRPEVRALVVDFVLGSLCDRDFARPLDDALAAPPPLGLRMPLAVGFGSRHQG